MEIEKEEEYSISTISDLESDSKSISNITDISKSMPSQLSNFDSIINSLKYKTYQDQFISLFNKYNIDINNLDKLILNYSNTKSQKKHSDNDYIIYAEKLLTQIYNIKYFLKENKINEVINEINGINEKILNEKLLFALHRQKLIYLIKKDMINESLLYAQKYLLPLSENNKILYNELEKVMGILGYKDIKDCPDKELLDGNDKILDKIEDEILSTMILFLINSFK
jgi:hypothetical protein